MTEAPAFGTASSTPDVGDSFRASDHQDKLVIFMGITKEETETDFGPATVAACSLIVVLDGDDGPQPFSDGWVFGKGLAPTLYRNPSDVVVGVVGKGEAKPGKNAPWKLLDPTEEQLEATRAWYLKMIVRSGSSEPYEYLYKPDEAPF
jgi:hypothetical protein